MTIYPGARLGDRVIIHAGAVLGADGFGYVRDRARATTKNFPRSGVSKSETTSRSERTQPSIEERSK